MSFSSIDEAFGNHVTRGLNSANIHKQPDVFEQTTSQELMYLLNPNNNSTSSNPFSAKKYGIESFNALEAKVPVIQQPNKPVEISHDLFIYHMLNCQSCQRRFGPRIGRHHLDERVLNTLIYIITMIFILFLLDIFVRLGAVLSRK